MCMCERKCSIVPTHQPVDSVDLLPLWIQGALEEAGPHPLSPGPQTTQIMDTHRDKNSTHIAFHNLTDVLSIRLIECTSLILEHVPSWQGYHQSGSCSLHAGSAFLV
ncbi:hypothetical protein AMECASPLE_001335 [Ameca splendens]|uniref:Uncharacterized protein n=1 Tax=Ameca splendens TaxID=208324 RepID=A0ABV0Y8W5_9TELE